MNKQLLLLLAAGAVAYFFLQKKKPKLTRDAAGFLRDSSGSRVGIIRDADGGVKEVFRDTSDVIRPRDATAGGRFPMGPVWTPPDDEMPNAGWGEPTVGADL